MSDAPAGNDYRSLALVSSAVATMVVPILIGVYLDDRNGWSPWGLVTGAVLGLGGTTAQLVRISRRKS